MKVRATRTTVTSSSETERPTDRQELISGWRQDRISQGRVLMLGAGALGNEAAKNLALMGLGYLFVADMDVVSRSNLSRAVFFHEQDAQERRSKAEIVAERALAMNVMPGAVTRAFHDDIVWRLGGGVWRRVDVVLGCLDNVEARMKANFACLTTGTPFLDGGILGLAGSVTAIQPPLTACWECTTTKRERDNATSRYDSCSNVMRRDIEAGRLPTVQVLSSIIASIQTLEAVKIIQGQPWARGYLITYDATTSRPDSDVLTIARRPNCWCNEAKPIETFIELPLSATRHTLRELRERLIQRGYSDIEFILPDQFVVVRHCIRCRHQTPLQCPRFRLNTSILVCPHCDAQGNEWIKLLSIGQTDQQEFAVRSIGEDTFVVIEEAEKLREQMLDMILSDIGFPSLALVQFSLSGQLIFDTVVELSGDAVEVMGGADYATVRNRQEIL